MRRLSSLAVLLTSLLLALTYLLILLATSGANRHDRALAALQTLFLNDAALQRDVLKARSGLLRNYDPLVRSVNELHSVVSTLRSDAHATSAGVQAQIDQYVQRLGSDVVEQEELLESLKSNIALLQNSLNFFGHTIRQLENAGAAEQGVLSKEIGRLANAMFRFTSDARPGNASEIVASLDRLSRWPTDSASPDIRALVSHGRLIVATLPIVDDSVSRLLATSTRDTARALQGAYLEAQAQAGARARLFGILLYIAGLALVAYVGYLFLRLRANARTLQARLEFERLVAAISAGFINLSRDGIDEGINDGLARLASHAGVDRAQIIVSAGDNGGITGSYLWSRTNISAPACGLVDVLWVARQWPFEEYEHAGCIHVPDVQALPISLQKSKLQRSGIRSWLCIPMWSGGKQVGFLTLDAASIQKHWSVDDIVLSRTAGEIFANAIERQRGEAEREMLGARLQQVQRLEAIGTLAGGIAHEFNNILGAILGYAELALSILGNGSRAERHVQGIMTAGERAQAVIKQILTFSRRGKRQLELVSAGPVVAEAVDLLRASLPSTVHIETALNAGDATVMVDPTQMLQVVMNLCTNGAQAMANRGTLHLRLDTVDVDEGVVMSHGSLSAGHYVRLAVQDTGSGIDPATLHRILEPFFTTKAVGQGTGLGLSMVHGIVTQHAGALNVESRPGQGSTFEAYFPCAGDAVVESQEKPRIPKASRGRGETILVVDDDAPLVPLAEEMLAALGYEAIGFDQSATALAAFRAAPDRFDLVLTDDNMPEMTGTELANALHEIRPGLPIILMTGGGRPISARRLQDVGIREVLKKPLLSATIADLLARHLSSQSSSVDQN